jgi:hypothetical protein
MKSNQTLNSAKVLNIQGSTLLLLTDHGNKLYAKLAASLFSRPSIGAKVLVYSDLEKNYVIMLLEGEGSIDMSTSSNLQINAQKIQLTCIDYNRLSKNMDLTQSLHKQTRVKGIKYNQSDISIHKNSQTTLHTDKFLVNS